MTFAQLGLTPDLLRAVARSGYTEPTPVQREAIPLVLAGRDLLAGAQTGTGKTAAFVLPMLQKLTASAPRLQPGQRPRIRALVLAPTRELAIQVEESIRTYGNGTARSTTIYGGVGFGGQHAALRRGVDIVVATPGPPARPCRAGHHRPARRRDPRPRRGRSHARHGLHPRHPPRSSPSCRRERQNLLFSATFSNEIRSLAEGMLDRPASVQVAPRNTPVDLIEQVIHPVDRERKRELLTHLVRIREIDQALVFTRTKHGANKLVEQLEPRWHRRLGDPRQQEPAAAHPRARRLQVPAASASSSRPRSRRAGSTSRSSRTS